MNPTLRVGLPLILACSLPLLNACSGDTSPTPPPPTPQQMGLILGVITPWTAGQASSVKTDELPYTAPVNAQGQFDFALPDHASMTGPHATLLYPVPDVYGLCQNVSTNAPATLRVYPINDLNTDKAQSLISEYDPALSNLNYRAWWFSNQDVTYHFQGNCLALGQISTTLTLQRGWNLLKTVTDPGVSTTYTIDTQPTTHVPWRLSTASALRIQGLHPDVLHPWRTLPQYQHR